MKYYLLGALIVYPATFLWAFYNAWSGNTDLQEMIMFGYAVFGLLVLSAYFRKKTHFLLSRICIYIFAIIVAWIALAIFVRLTHFV
jgi:hypothetical protein